MVDVSFIIVTMNTRHLLKECLESVVQCTVPKEIIVVDNASTDGTVEMVRNEFPTVQLLCNESNERFAKPNNDAMQIARGRYLFLLNSDATLKANAVENLVAYLDDHPEIGMVGPQLLNPDGSIQPSCRGMVSLWSHICDMLFLDRLFPRSRFFAGTEMTFFDHTTEQEIDHVMAAAVLVRSEIAKTVGVFDERLSIYYNDLDWSYRIRKAGWKIAFFPGAQVIHHGGKTALPLVKSPAIFREQYENIVYFYKKHFGSFTVFLYKILLIVGFVPRLLFWSARKMFDNTDLVKAKVQFCAWTLHAALSFGTRKTIKATHRSFTEGYH